MFARLAFKRVTIQTGFLGLDAKQLGCVAADCTATLLQSVIGERYRLQPDIEHCAFLVRGGSTKLSVTGVCHCTAVINDPLVSAAAAMVNNDHSLELVNGHDVAGTSAFQIAATGLDAARYKEYIPFLLACD
jgi:hypothetical protein